MSLLVTKGPGMHLFGNTSRMHSSVWVRLALLFCLFSSALHAQQSPTRSEELFVHRVLPVFREKCFACHGDDPAEVRGEFNMLSRNGLLNGGESEEPAMVPNNASDSPLFQAISWDGLEMPPKENDRLDAEQIEQVREWIDSGAAWPNEDRIVEIREATKDKWEEGISVATSGGLSNDWTNRKYDPANLWAYQPLWNDPDGILQGDANPIDTLVNARLQELKLVAAPPADRRTLIRRATFDLIGLPPTTEEIEAFVDDPSPDDTAVAKLVDRLLESPHYGERWAQHWLDVVRYADSSGYANDFERGNAWRYRDYVVRSFNQDKPYDSFVREQIAGDEIDASDPEMLVAAGFLRMGPWELTSMEVPKVARQRFLDDVTDAVGQVFLGHMLQCARCHDHKFDPIPTRDYYSMQAIFATTQLVERNANFLDEENRNGFAESKYLRGRKEFFGKRLSEVSKKESLQAARDWYAKKEVDATEFEEVVKELSKRDAKQPSLQMVLDALAGREVAPDRIPPRRTGFEPEDFGIERICRKEQERLRWRLERYQPFALSVYSGKTPTYTRVNAPLRMPKKKSKSGVLEKTSILTGGDPFSAAEAVSPAVLSAAGTATEVPDAISGRRATLANWIASQENPLTPRVMVNRIWQWHFGNPIAGNPNNFGTTGKKPTHPELLDYLAKRFMDEGWSIKSMHRLIMTSSAYRRSSTHPDAEAVSRLDPTNESYSRFATRRLTAEELRDAMLSCSGELNREIGGIPARPEMNMEAALQPRMVMGTFAEAWQPSLLPRQRHRRSLYVLRIRGLRDPFLEVFNSPASEVSCEARESSMVTPQVFAMFNSEISFDRALALANRVLSERKDSQVDDERIVDDLFRATYGRKATEDELSSCVAHWRKMTAKHETLRFEKTEYPIEVVREAVEENTGVKFKYTEPLEMYVDFVPDLKPSEANARVRGLAEVCLVLLNSNEFAYVY